MSGTSLPEVTSRAIVAADVFYKLAEDKLGGALKQYLHFPRDIEPLISDSLDLPIISIADLTLHAASAYLCIKRAQPEEDRKLQGLFHVGSPGTMILIEEHLSVRARNYVIAHELGHYIHDVFMAQQLWLSSLQERKEAIRQAFSWQALDPWLELQVFVKGLPDLPRTITKRGVAMRQETYERELFADAIALELLAPWQEAAALFQKHSKSEFVKRIQMDYGVPSLIANYYYRDVRHMLLPQQDLFDHLFAPLRNTTDQ